MKTTWAVVVWGQCRRAAWLENPSGLSSDDGFETARDAGASADVADVEAVPVDAVARQSLDVAQVDDVAAADGDGAQADAQVAPEAQPNGALQGGRTRKLRRAGGLPTVMGSAARRRLTCSTTSGRRQEPSTRRPPRTSTKARTADSRGTCKEVRALENIEFLATPGSDPNLLLASSATVSSPRRMPGRRGPSCRSMEWGPATSLRRQVSLFECMRRSRAPGFFVRMMAARRSPRSITEFRLAMPLRSMSLLTARMTHWP